MKAAGSTVLLLAAGLLLAGCAPAEPVHDRTAAGSAVMAPGGSPTSREQVDEAAGGTHSPVAEPVWDDPSRKAAVEAAETLMKAFARPDLSEDAWWAAMEPLLSTEAQLMYAAVDPANVPPREVSGSGQLLDEASAYIARVRVPTNVGPYTVVLSRDAAGAAWEGERITPPEGLN